MSVKLLTTQCMSVRLLTAQSMSVKLLTAQSMSVKLLTAHHLEFLSLKEGCTGSSESTLVKIPHCWKSHVVAQLYIVK